MEKTAFSLLLTMARQCVYIQCTYTQCNMHLVFPIFSYCSQALFTAVPVGLGVWGVAKGLLFQSQLHCRRLGEAD
jgi:hypothetical protein